VTDEGVMGGRAVRLQGGGVEGRGQGLWVVRRGGGGLWQHEKRRRRGAWQEVGKGACRNVCCATAARHRREPTHVDARRCVSVQGREGGGAECSGGWRRGACDSNGSRVYLGGCGGVRVGVGRAPVTTNEVLQATANKTGNSWQPARDQVRVPIAELA
jgi:hypothetical protein